VTQFESFRPPTRANDGDGIDARFVFKITSTAGFPDDHVLELRELQVLGNDDSSVYFVLAGDGGEAFAAALQTYSEGEDVDGGHGELKSLYNKIDAVGLYGPADRMGPGMEELPDSGNVVIDLTIWPSKDLKEAKERVALTSRTIVELGGEVLDTSVLPRFSALRCRVDVEQVPTLLNLYVIEKARTPPVPYIDPSDWRAVDAGTLTIERLPGGTVGVLDDLPAIRHPVLLGGLSIAEPAMDLGRPWREPGHHGSMVAGATIAPALARDLRDGSTIHVRGTAIAIRVLEPSAFNGDQTEFPPEVLPAHLIVQSIRKLHSEHGVRVFNLSFGYDYDYSPSHVGDLSEMIDELARELDIVIVVAAGNVQIGLDGTLPGGHHVMNDYPIYADRREHGLAQPANAAIAVTVGGISESDAPAETMVSRLGRRAVAAIGHLSPFSRTGPGHGRLANRMNKPDFVAAAGNVVVDDVGMVDLRDQGTGTLTTALSPTGQLFRMSHGTSFAAPSVAGVAATVVASYPEASGNLVRALLASSATAPAGARQVDDYRVRHNRYGFGSVSLFEATQSYAQRVSMTFDGEMAVDTSVIHPVPVPEEFALPRSASRSIRIALAFDPPVRRTRLDYTAATMVTDAYRAVSLEQLQELLVEQDSDEPQPLFSDRRRIRAFVPPHTAHRESTLQVKDWSPKKLDIGDGDTYFVVVTHKSRTWFRDRDDYQTQRYSLVVTLVDEEQITLDLPLSVLETVSVRARARTRTRV